MPEQRIEELWSIAYGNQYLRLPKYPQRNALAEAWLRSLPERPHVRFARLIEAELGLLPNA